MARAGGHALDELPENPIFQDIDHAIGEILKCLTIQSKKDVAERLVDNVGTNDIEKVRDELFNAACGIYDEQLEASGVSPSEAQLKLINRRTGNVGEKAVKSAWDVIEFTLYICGYSDFFPRETLSSRGTYIDLKRKARTDSITSRTDSQDSEKSLVTRFSKLEEDYKKLWNYILNVEKKHNDELVDIRGIVNKEPAVNGLTGETGQHKDKPYTPNTSANAGPVTSMRNNVTVPTNTQTHNMFTHVPADAHSPGSLTVLLGSPTAISDTHAPVASVDPAVPHTSQGHAGSGSAHGPVASVDPAGPNTSQGHAGSASAADDVVRQKPPPSKSKTNDNPNPNNAINSVSGDWNLVENKHTKKQNARENKAKLSAAKPKNKSDIKLKSSKPQVKSADMYLVNVNRESDDTLADVADRVRSHCSDVGLRVMYARVITNRYSKSTVGCRITIPATQVDDALSGRIWPDEMKCRRWKNNGNAGNDGNDRQKQHRHQNDKSFRNDKSSRDGRSSKNDRSFRDGKSSGNDRSLANGRSSRNDRSFGNGKPSGNDRSFRGSQHNLNRSYADFSDGRPTDRRSAKYPPDAQIKIILYTSRTLILRQMTTGG